ncbi:acyltransferase [uncultured Polaribacter sp.]|uniref:acyltransferase n=1 Tax=uncultured Polaribacter sp. TaxID=174711 RepID=UPI00338F663D
MKKKENNPNYNLLRLVACFLVVLHHVIAFYELKLNGNFPILRIVSSTCVPLFIILSGALLVFKEENSLYFYKKRLKAVLFPFLFWILLYTIYRLLSNLLNQNEGYINILQNILGIGGWPYYHLWYIYLIIYLYFITPFLRKIIYVFPKKKQVIISTILFFIFFTISFYNDGFLWSKYISYYLAGGIISKNFYKTNYLILLAIVFLTFLGVYYFNFMAIKSFLFSILCFLIIIKTPRLKSVNFVIPFTLGIYLVHPIILKTVTKVVSYNNLLLTTLITFVFSLFFIVLMKKNKFLKKVV